MRCDGRTDPEGVHMDEQVVDGTGSSENDTRIYVGEKVKLGNPNSMRCWDFEPPQRKHLELTLVWTIRQSHLAPLVTVA